jgi:hypothetical protein
MTTIINTILTINPKAEVTVSGDDVNTIVWNNGTTPIPANEILAKQQELITEYNSKQYQRDRAKEYPSIQEQLDMQYWDKVNNTNNWQTKVNEIKVKYPKP